MDQPLPIYVHIPKTGGTSYCTALMHSFDGPKRYSVMGLREQNRLKSQAIKDLPPKRVEQLQVIFGHLTQQVHEHLNRPATYFTLVREPFSRLKSAYRQECRYLKRKGQPVPEIETFIREFQLQFAHYFFNRTEIETGKQAGTTANDWMEQAMERIENQYAAVGLTEKMDASLVLFNETFGWDIYRVEDLNVSDQRMVAEQDAQTEALEQHYREQHPCDFELYTFIKSRFEAAWQAVPNHASKLEDFQQRKAHWNARQQRLDQLIPGHARLRKIAFEIRKIRY